MIKWITNIIHRITEEETLKERFIRMRPGALYGFIAASAYILTLSTINVISYSGQHLGIDWIRLLSYWFSFGLGLALAGVIVGWFTESYMGIIVGGFILTGLLLIGNLIVTFINGSGLGIAVQSVVTTIPLIGACVLLALGLRMTINRHVHILQDEPAQKRARSVAGLVALIFFIGFFPGFLGRFDRTTIDVVHSINKGISGALVDPAMAQARFPVVKFPALKDHFDMDYRLYPRPSSLAAGALEITIRFQDGYALTCLVSSEAVAQVYLTDCNEGTSYIYP
jgi:hypothetical protein